MGACFAERLDELGLREGEHSVRQFVIEERYPEGPWTTDGGAVYPSTGSIDDAGMWCDGGCGETDVLLSGPFDPSSRVWTAGFLWPHGQVQTYPALLTFSADGTRFTGIMSDDTGVAGKLVRRSQRRQLHVQQRLERLK